MMGWNWNYGMMNGSWGTSSPLGSIFGIVVLIDFILLGFWLWKQIGKK